ncbi:hypothetical protein Ac2012v2_002123 [Leucoagaricus gongylophorus]
MEVVGPRRRQAAVKASANLVESSSDESRKSGSEDEDYQLAPHIRRSKSWKDKVKAYGSKRSGIPQAVNVIFTGTEVRKRKRASTVNVQMQQKRRRGATHNVSNGISGGDESGLTLADEQMETKPLVRPLAEFPLQSTSTLRASKDRQLSSKDRQPSRLKSQVNPSVEELSLEEDSDDLPDIGMVLSHQDVSSRKGKRPQELTQKCRSKSRRKYSQDDGRELIDDTSTTQTSISDHFNLSYLNDDYDLELNSVSIGDLCLARVTAVGSTYWPARILEIKRSSTGKGKQKRMFRVMFLDRKEKYIPRDQFYTTSQDEFRTCIIGEFESSHIDVVNDFDEGTQKDTISTGCCNQSSSRSLSLVNVGSLPILSGPDFCDLPLHYQLPYVTPILKAIMTEEATWALRRHNMYIKGGTMRQKLKNEGGMRGAVDAQNADDFLPLVEVWCLGDQYVRNNIHDGGERLRVDGLARADPVLGTASSKSSYQAVDLHLVVETQGVTAKMGAAVTEEPQAAEVRNPPEIESTRREPNSAFPFSFTPRTIAVREDDHSARLRQRGSPDYENLSPLDKVQYCLDVLIPEAFNQILLWRTGERKSVEVMWDNIKEEERLHDRGEELLEETDWVMDIMRLRKIMETSLDKNKLGKEPTSNKALRKTRSGRIGGVVGCYKE